MISRLRSHPGLAAVLVVLLMLPAPLIWLGSSTNLLEPVLYSAVIEADTVFDAECNMVSQEITSVSGRKNHVAKLEALTSERMFHSVSHSRDMWTHLRNKGWTPAEIEAFARDLELSSCVDHAGKFTTRSRLWRGWLNLMTFQSGALAITYEKVQG